MATSTKPTRKSTRIDTIGDKPKGKGSKTTKPAARPAVKASVASRIAGGDQALLKRALKDPGLRSKLPDKYLPAAQRQTRQLNQPVTPGSTMTQRMLATAATAAGTTAYGPKEAKLTEGLGIAQTQARDTGAFYQDYQRQLQQHAAAVQGYQAGAQAALAQTAAGVTGLAGQQQGDLQQQANQGAAAVGAAPAANMAPTANAAELSRQNLMGSFQAQQGLNAASQNTYADAVANQVAPTQKLSAEAQGQQKVAAAQKKISDLAGERGAAEQKYKSETTATEAKNVAAMSIAGDKDTLARLKLQQDANQFKATNTTTNRRITSTEKTADKRIQAQKDIADKRNTAAAKTAAQKAALAAGKVNKYGYTEAAWSAMSVGQRQNVIRAFGPKGSQPATADKKAADAFKAKYGIAPLTTVAHNKAKDDISRAETYVRSLVKKNPKKLGEIGNALSQGVAAGKDDAGNKTPAIPRFNRVLVRAAMDIYQYGGVTPGTATRLHKAGYSVSQLGVPSVKSGPGAIVGALASSLGNIK